MVAVNGADLYNFIKDQTKIVKTLSNKEIVLSIFASQHLRGHHDFYSGTGTAATGVGLVFSLFAVNPMFTAVTIVTGCFGALTAFYNMRQSCKLNKFISIFSDELITRYPDILTAYMEISTMIRSIEREEILEFFEKANKNK
jgi:hypothetical protein